MDPTSPSPLPCYGPLTRKYGGGSGGGGVARDSSGGGGVCFDFKNGHCNRGDGCRFRYTQPLIPQVPCCSPFRFRHEQPSGGGGGGGSGGAKDKRLHETANADACYKCGQAGHWAAANS